MTKQEIENYYNSLIKSINEKKEDYKLNNDRTHNSTILRCMFNNFTKINMYCGELSVLRKSFYDYVRKNNKDGAELGNYLEEEINKSFKFFIEKNDSRFRVILEKKIDANFDDFICKELFDKYFREGKIEISSLPDYFGFKKNLDHFAFTDGGEMIRIEEDRVERNAMCVFYNEKLLSMMKDNYKKLSEISEPFKGN